MVETEGKGRGLSRKWVYSSASPGSPSALRTPEGEKTRPASPQTHHLFPFRFVLLGLCSEGRELRVQRAPSPQMQQGGSACDFILPSRSPPAWSSCYVAPVLDSGTQRAITPEALPSRCPPAAPERTVNARRLPSKWKEEGGESRL